jgi:hypothetical protein
MSWTARAHNQRATQAATLAAVLRDLSPPELHEIAAEKSYYASNGGDHLKLRGIPAIGRNVAGAIPGTSPHAIR